MARNTLFAVSLLLVFLISLQATAQGIQLAQLTESDFYEDFPVVLTATHLKQSQKNAPIATTIIDRDMIEASGFTEITDLLRLAPGMLVNYDSGHVLAAGYQFLFHRYTVRMQVLVDGRSVYTPTFGEMPWTQLGITIDDIERIEVIRGPSSSSYGPNAMTAVISIITRHAAQDKGIKAKVNSGNFGLQESFITVGGNNVNLDYKISVAKRENDGFHQRYDGKDISIFNFRGDYQVTNNDNLTFNINVNSSELQEDNAIAAPTEHPNHIKKVLNRSQQIRWSHTFSNGDDFSLSYYQQDYHDRNRYDAEFTVDDFFGPGLDLILPFDRDESVKTKRQNLEFVHSVFSDNHNLSWGIILRKDKTTAPQYLYQVTQDTVNTKQLFINTEHTIDKQNILNIGLLADNNDTADTTYSSRISYNRHFDNNNTLRISYAKAFRNPFSFEEYTNYYIPDLNLLIWDDQEDLEAEEIRTYDIGYISYLYNRNTEIDIRLFNTELSNLIILDENIGGSFTNGEAFTIKGLEATIKHRFNDTTAIFNYAYTKSKANKLIYSSAESYKTGTPIHNTSMLLMHKFSISLNGSIGYYYTGEMHQLCCSGDTQPSRKRLDLTLSKSFKLDKYNSKLKLVLQNITDEKVDTRLLNNYDRQGYISFSMEL
jgi:iron complex outermembrane receptor protein